jgi:hypothetical protein
MLMRAGLGWLVLEVMGFGTGAMYEEVTTSPSLFPDHGLERGTSSMKIYSLQSIIEMMG